MRGNPEWFPLRARREQDVTTECIAQSASPTGLLSLRYIDGTLFD